MKVSVERIIPNDDLPDFPYIEVHVSFREDHDDPKAPFKGVNVVIFLEKKNLPLFETQNLAIQKAKAFLSQIVSEC